MNGGEMVLDRDRWRDAARLKLLESCKSQEKKKKNIQPHYQS